MTFWIEYQPISIEFRNGAKVNARRIGFRSALMTFNRNERTVAIVQLDTPPAEQRRLIDLFSGFELMAIRYKIWVYAKAGAEKTVAPPIPYCHPFPRGSGVFVAAGTPANRFGPLFLRQADGRNFFSDAFKLSEVSDGTIASDQPVFQFLEP